MVPEKPKTSPLNRKNAPPSIVPPRKPTSELGVVVVKFKATVSVKLLLTFSNQSGLKGCDTVRMLKSGCPANVMSTLLTVPFVTSTTSVPPKVPEEGLEKVPETSKVVMVSAFTTPVMSVSAGMIRARAKRCVFFFCVFMGSYGLMTFSDAFACQSKRFRPEMSILIITISPQD